MFMKVSESLNTLQNDGQTNSVLGVALVLIENMIVSNMEQDCENSELNILKRMFEQARADYNTSKDYLI